MDELRPAGPDFDLLAASLRADASDLRTFLNVLAAKLEDALPGHVSVQRDGGPFARDHPVRALQVVLGEHRYALEWAHGELVAEVGPEARGTAGERVTLDRCIEMLALDLSDQARASTQARSAMDSLLAGQLPAETVARPSAAEGQIVFRWPQPRTSRSSQLVVGPDEQAVVVLEGVIAGPLPPGRHALDEIVPANADENGARAGEVEGQIYFVLGRELPGLKFGGMIDKVVDPQTGLAVGLRVFGDYTLRVCDPKELVVKLGGGPDQSGNPKLVELVRDLLLKALREDVVTHIGEKGWPILGLAAHGPEIEAETLRAVQILAGGYGLEVSRMGNFTISMKDEDEALLTAHRARLASAALDSGAQVCGGCGSQNSASAHFCLSCGRPLATACAGCGTENPSGARFCQSCGKSLAAIDSRGGDA